MIIALIFGIFGIFGGACNIAGTACGAAKIGIEQGIGSKSQNQAKESVKDLADLGAKGVFAAFFSAISLVFGVIIGYSKTAKMARLFSLLLIASGIIATMFTNYFSGPILTIAGVIGLIGSRDDG
ncbi:MAG: hypothetical protein K8R21_00310 [Leptospira sp.]|nr:hypothetical protein [Leptospira sp.]